MNKPPGFVIRGRRAAIAIANADDMAVVRRQFDRLGVVSLPFEVKAETDELPDADILFVDDDFLTVPGFTAIRSAYDLPVVVLIGTETPSRLKMVIDCKPAAFLMKPLRSAGLYAALVVAFARSEEMRDTRARIQKLEERVRSRRVLISAVLRVMSVNDLDESGAFALMRRSAMEQRKSIEQIGAEIVSSRHVLSQTKQTA